MSQIKPITQVESVVIKFAGDSGDGMQLTGSRFTTEAALSGNDLRTFPDFPAEIRAPAGTLAGVSAFQLRFADDAIFTPGDELDVSDRAFLHDALESSADDVASGHLVDAEEVLAELRVA